MRLRLELFVEDIDSSMRFYERALAFRLDRREADYASLERGSAVLGLGSIAKLPADGAGPGVHSSRPLQPTGRSCERVADRSGRPSRPPRDFALAGPDHKAGTGCCAESA